MNYTSREQSKHLLELGLSHETADMVYGIGLKYPAVKYGNEFFNEEKFNIFSLYYPCWSIGALLELIPLNIGTYSITFCKNNDGTYFSSLNDIKNESVFYTDNLNLIETLFKVVCWLLENNYIEK